MERAIKFTNKSSDYVDEAERERGKVSKTFPIEKFRVWVKKSTNLNSCVSTAAVLVTVLVRIL